MVPSDVDGDDVIVFWLVLVFHDEALLIVRIDGIGLCGLSRPWARAWIRGVRAYASRSMEIKKHRNFLFKVRLIYSNDIGQS